MAARICRTSPSSRRCSTRRSARDTLLRRVARPPCRYRRHRPWLDAPRGDADRGGRRLYRQFQAGRGRLLREAALVELLTAALSGPQRRAEHQRSQGAGRSQRERRGRPPQDVADFGLDVVQAYMGHVQDNAAESVARVHRTARDGELESRSIRARSSGLDQLRPATRRGYRRLHRDSAAAARNFQCAGAGDSGCVLYVFRRMVEDDIPMNAGCLRAIEIVMPEGSMLSPAYPAAVVAGNVETSQAITNCLFARARGARPGARHHEQSHLRQRAPPILRDGLLRRAGRPRLRRRGGGAHPYDQFAAHRPEVLELRYPVLLEGFEIRRGSGGGGNGTLATGRFE